jgi:hypothetical protein
MGTCAGVGAALQFTTHLRACVLTAETDQCTYFVIIRSVHGCPTQCPVVGGHLCSGHGTCSYDGSASTARCFCYSGWTGTDCSAGAVAQRAPAAAVVHDAARRPAAAAVHNARPPLACASRVCARLRAAGDAPTPNSPGGPVAGGLIGGILVGILGAVGVSYYLSMKATGNGWAQLKG